MSKQKKQSATESIQDLLKAAQSAKTVPESVEKPKEGERDQNTPQQPALAKGVEAMGSTKTPVVVDSTPTQPYKKKLGGRSGAGFKPGVSGNPAGPKPGYHWGKTYLIKLIKETAKTTEGKDIEIGEAIARAQVKQALTGDTRAFNAIFDRIDGKAPQPHVGDDGEDPIRFDLGIERTLENGYGEDPQR